MSGDEGASNRGAPARLDPSGEVVGSGAGAGGGSPEDQDADSASGAGGDVQPWTARPDQSGGDAPDQADHNGRAV